MFERTSSQRFVLALLVAAGVAHVVLFNPAPLLLRTLAAWSLVALLPGAALVRWLLPRQAGDAGRVDERLLYALGAGVGLQLWVTLALVALPGALTGWQMLAAFDLLLLLFAGLLLRSTASRQTREPLQRTTGTPFPLYRPAIVLLAIILLAGGVLRLARLGETPFQGDEATSMVYAAAAVQGHDRVLFQHRRGPLDILLPAGQMVLTTQIDETSARLPFALMGIAAIAAIALAGRRMAGANSAGLVAALLVSLDGYLIAFSRVMHYESVVVLNSLLALLLMHRVLRHTRTGAAAVNVRGELYLLALLLATGMAAHYDGVVVLLPLGLLALYSGWTPMQWWRAAGAPALLGLGLLLAFYGPFLTSSEFQATLAFYRESLVDGTEKAGGVNHLGYLAESVLFYNGGAKTALLLILTAGVMVRWLWRPSLPVYRLAAWLLAGGLLLQLFAPERLTVAGSAVAPWLILLTGVLLIAAPRQPAMIRAWWLWFFLPFALAMFVVQEPGLHFYYFFVPWFLLLGEGWAALERVAARRVARRTVVAGSVLLWGALAIVAGTASYRFFLAPDASVLTYKEAWRPPTWWPMQTRQYDHFLYGIANPSGWKGIGVLLAGGELEMPLSTNVDRWTADWYSRGAEYCRPDPALAAIDVTSKQERGATMIAAMEGSLRPVGAIQRGGAPVIELFGRGEQRAAVAVEALDPLFDRWLSPASALALTPETALPVSPLNAAWGDQVAATGFLVQQLTGIDAPSLALTVQWTALARPAADYTAELLLVDPADPNRVAGRRLVALSCSAGAAGGWKAGKAATGYYRIAVDPAADGVFDVRLRLVDPATGTSLPVRADAPVLPGDQLTLTQVTFNR